MKNRIHLISLGFLSTLLLTGCGKKEKAETIPHISEAIPVKTIPLNKADISGTIYSSGQFTTDDETKLSFKTMGAIRKIMVKEGDAVKKGQVLATLDLAEITAQLNQAHINLEKTSRDYKRIENLYKDSVTTLEQLQNSKTMFEIAQQQVASAQFNLSYSEIRAPHDGVVIKKIGQEGQIVSAGSPVLETSSKGNADWILRVAVSDQEWTNISLGDSAKVQALNFNNLNGYVYAKAENADQLTGSFSIDIKLTNGKKLNVASGMFGKAEIMVSKKRNAWQIPYDALLDGNGSQGFVFVTNDQKTAVKVAVKIESIDKNTVSISEGLSAYKDLIVSGSAYLTHKSAIRVIAN